MDRKLVVKLLQNEVKYPLGKHRVWICRCFEITVRSDQVVEVDEYESFTAEDGVSRKQSPQLPRKTGDIYHVGRSTLHLKKKQVMEESGIGWRKFPERNDG